MGTAHAGLIIALPSQRHHPQVDSTIIMAPAQALLQIAGTLDRSVYEKQLHKLCWDLNPDQRHCFIALTKTKPDSLGTAQDR